MERIEAKELFSPQTSQWKFSKVLKMKQLKKPYKICDKEEFKRSMNFANIINLESKDGQVSRNPAGLPLKAKTSFPQIDQRGKFRSRIRSIGNESYNSSDTKSVKHISNILSDGGQSPFYRNQCFIGNKKSSFLKKGKMSNFRDKGQNSPHY